MSRSDAAWRAARDDRCDDGRRRRGRSRPRRLAASSEHPSPRWPWEPQLSHWSCVRTSRRGQPIGQRWLPFRACGSTRQLGRVWVDGAGRRRPRPTDCPGRPIQSSRAGAVARRPASAGGRPWAVTAADHPPHPTATSSTSRVISTSPSSPPPSRRTSAPGRPSPAHRGRVRRSAVSVDFAEFSGETLAGASLKLLCALLTAGVWPHVVQFGV